MSKDDIIPVGKIIGLHGIKGEVKVFPYGDLEGVEWKTVFVSGGKAGEGGEGRGDGQTKAEKPPVKAFAVKKARIHKGLLILELAGYPTRTEAGSLVGLEVGVLKGDLPELEEDEYYYFDLIGMDVVTDEDRPLGRITNVISTGSNDVLEVKGPIGEVLIPAIDSIIIEVDAIGRRVTVRLLEGLIPGETEQ